MSKTKKIMHTCFVFNLLILTVGYGLKGEYLMCVGFALWSINSFLDAINIFRRYL